MTIPDAGSAVAGAIACGQIRASRGHIRIGLIDPLSGPAATTGEVGSRPGSSRGEVNASGGLNGQKLEVVGMTTSMNPQENSKRKHFHVDVPPIGSANSLHFSLSLRVAPHNRNTGFAGWIPSLNFQNR